LVETVTPWNAANDYAVGDKVRRDTTNRIYENVIAGIDAVTPEVAELAEIPRWVDIGPTNKYAVLDEQVGTTTKATSPLTFKVKTGTCTSVALFGIKNAHTADVVVQNGILGPVVYTKTVTLDATIINDWFDYFFELSVPKPDLVITDIPPYFDAYVTVTLTGVSGATVECGVFLAGLNYDLGATQYGATAGITDYSRKDTDDFGNATFVRRAYSKRMNVKLTVDNTKLNKIQYVLAELRATPSAWLGASVPGFDPLTVYGFYKDFTIEVEYANQSRCDLEIEGLI
jgi:hypothetical protein